MGMSLKDKAVFFRQLANLIESGIPIMGCLESLGRSNNHNVRNIVKAVSQNISQGELLSGSLGAFPGEFDNYIIEMIRAGEVGGALEIRLKNIADYLEAAHDRRMQLITRLIYPLLIVHAAIFIPPLVLLFTGSVAQYLKATLIPLFFMYFTIIIVYLIYRFLKSIPGIAEATDAILIHFPLIGSYFRAVTVYRYTMILSDLTEGGVPLDLALETSAKACGNSAAQAVFMKIREGIKAGRTLSQCLRDTRLFSETSLQIIQSGEDSGTISGMMKKASVLLRQDLDNAVNIMFTIIPIIMFLMVAVYVGFVIIKNFSSFINQNYNIPMN